MYSSALAQSHISVYSSTYTIQSKRWTSHLWHNQLLHPLKKRTSPSSSYSDYSLHYSLGQGILAQSKFYHGFCKKAESCYDYVVSNSPFRPTLQHESWIACPVHSGSELPSTCCVLLICLRKKKCNVIELLIVLASHDPSSEWINLHPPLVRKFCWKDSESSTWTGVAGRCLQS